MAASKATTMTLFQTLFDQFAMPTTRHLVVVRLDSDNASQARSSSSIQLSASPASHSSMHPFSSYLKSTSVTPCSLLILLHAARTSAASRLCRICSLSTLGCLAAVLWTTMQPAKTRRSSRLAFSLCFWDLLHTAHVTDLTGDLARSTPLKTTNASNTSRAACSLQRYQIESLRHVLSLCLWNASFTTHVKISLSILQSQRQGKHQPRQTQGALHAYLKVTRS